MGRTTLTISRETLARLKRMKEELGLRTYEEVIVKLVEEHRTSKARELVDRLMLRDREAEKLREIVRERRGSWWRRSY
ncbi:MAG: hypothetical protein QI223_08450 [Candidatus Korarchaeota archaeon]|nr:hypothetical protein [Candidatus Korarchaeota archaeon]